MFNFKKDNNIVVGNYQIDELVKKHGTPLVVYDQKYLEGKMDIFQNVFSSERFETEVLFASKSASIIGLYKVLFNRGFSFDVVSSGEMFVALSAGVNPKNIYFHGNNKTQEELEFAYDKKIGTIMVDNVDELKRIDALSKKSNHKMEIIVRINPHISAGKNEKIQTANDDSKFGISVKSSFDEVYKILNENVNLIFRGFHAHIGSQITVLDPFKSLVDSFEEFIVNFSNKYPSLAFDTINLGGGFGVKYTDETVDLKSMMGEYIQYIESKLSQFNFIKRIMIEPGRSMVAESGLTAYTVGGFKKTPSGKTHIYVDGGMADNIRPSLYDARYTFDIHAKHTTNMNYIISGKCCESGDTLHPSYDLPQAEIGDILVTYTTGAYTYSMASNYNQLRKPEVILVNGNEVKVIAKRQTYEDLIAQMV